MSEGMVIDAADDGQRLDRWLKKYFPAVSFGDMQKLLRTGQVRVDGKRAKGDVRLKEGQTIRIPPQLLFGTPKKEKAGISEKDEAFIQSLVIYKDDDFIAINKPAGLATQGGTKINKHIDGMLDGLKFGGPRPHLVHRLDKDTSGVMLLARTPNAARAAGDIFKGRSARKYYWAITTPTPEMPEGKLKSTIAKVNVRGGERVMAVNDDDGKMALTYYSVIETVGTPFAWVAFWPRTGRMHQIRVQAADMGCPLLGDFKYGCPLTVFDENPDLSRVLHLHARRLVFKHPFTGKKVDITAPLGLEMKKTFKFFGFNADDKSDPFLEVE